MNLYNHTRALFAAGSVDLAALKVMLVDGDYTFDAAEDDMTLIAAQEVSGNGWAAGGPTLAGVAVTEVGTNGAMLDANDVSVEASGGDIGPAAQLVVYDDTNDYPLFHYEFPADRTANAGTPFNINWHANGIARWTPPA
jgi:hypothetical protein